MEVKSVGGYIRVSSQEQSLNGLSLETQRAEIESYCRSHGYRLNKIYIDRGITARKNLYKREAFMEMMSDVSEGKINHIVILRLDRFFRNVYDYHRMMNEYLIPNGCGWSAVKEDYDTTTTNGRLMINLRLSIAEQECDQDSDRIKDVQANRVREGYVISGSTPTGYKIVDKRLVLNDDANIAKDIFDTFMYTNSIKMTMLSINAKYQADYRYVRIKRVLHNELYTGVYRGNENFCPAIIDGAYFEQVQERLKSNIKAKINHRVYIFAGLLRCNCGYKLVGSVTKDHKYYRCNNAYNNRLCDNTHHIPEEYIENYLLENVDRLMSSYIIDIQAKEKSAPQAKSNRDQIQKKVSRLTELYVNELIDLNELRSRKAELEAQIMDIEVPKPKDLTAITEFLNSGFRNVYSDLTDEEKICLWRGVIKEIRMDGNQISSILFL